MEEPMNSRNEVVSRMLKLFPKRIIQDYFGEEIEEIVEHREDADIFEFARTNLDFTKQHVYLLEHNIKKLNDLPECNPTKNAMKCEGKDTVEYYYFYDVTYRIFLQEPYEKINLVFMCPIHIVVYKNLIVINCTILEKNIQSYFPQQNVLTARKSVEESQIISLLTNDLGTCGTLVTCDLNKGVKELWKRDFIDAIEVQYLKTKSTSKETMHEDFTFKKQYPDLYKKAIIAPLMKASFKFIASKDEYCKHFAIEPSLGRLTFPTFSKEKEHNQNVIRKILEFN